MVLGVGNLLLGDDGVGVHVVRDLQEHPDDLPEGTRVVDGGTFGLELAPRLYDVRRLVIVDAVDHRAAAGHVGVWRGDDVARVFSHPVSVHHVGVDALLGALTLVDAAPAEVTVVGVQPADVTPGIGLSEPVRAAMPALRASVVAALGAPVAAGRG
jgi:hydrogenase maturation protease